MTEENESITADEFMASIDRDIERCRRIRWWRRTGLPALVIIIAIVVGAIWIATSLQT